MSHVSDCRCTTCNDAECDCDCHAQIATPTSEKKPTIMPDQISLMDKYEPAMTITDEIEAQAYFNQCVEHCMRIGRMGREEAERIERQNIGYYSSYFNKEAQQRVERLYQCVHPLFGPMGKDGLTRVEDAYYLGMSLATPQKSRLMIPRKVCLCGSTRFCDDRYRNSNGMTPWQQAMYDETLAGRIVLTIGVDFRSDAALGLNAVDKVSLDDLHLRKIDDANEILVLNVVVDGEDYVGESTDREIRYALAQGKFIRWLNPDAIPERYREMLTYWSS